MSDILSGWEAWEYPKIQVVRVMKPNVFQNMARDHQETVITIKIRPDQERELMPMLESYFRRPL